VGLLEFGREVLRLTRETWGRDSASDANDGTQIVDLVAEGANLVPRLGEKVG
jgi:hypothetical protein